MDIDQLIQKLARSHSPVSMGDFVKVAAHFGYALDHVSGSHYVFRNWTGKKFVVPVHNKKVKAIYVRMFIKDQS